MASDDSDDKLKKSTSQAAAASAFYHYTSVVVLLVCLFGTYTLETAAPTLDYWGRGIMLLVQVVHLIFTAMYGLRVDWVLVALLANLAAFTRFWRIEDPNSIIFDEAHFNKFTTWYISRHYYVDIHPPLAKLVFAAVLYVLGFKGAQEEKIEWWVEAERGGFIGTKDWLLLYETEWGSPYIPLRRTSATMGTLFVVVVFLSARAIGLGRVASTFGAWLAMAELVVLLQSRAILCDIFLYTFNVATIGASFASAMPGLSQSQRTLACLATGVLLGFAMSVKLTALGTLATVGIHQGLVLFLGPDMPSLFIQGKVEEDTSSSSTGSTSSSGGKGAGVGSGSGEMSVVEAAPVVAKKGRAGKAAAGAASSEVSTTTTTTTTTTAITPPPPSTPPSSPFNISYANATVIGTRGLVRALCIFLPAAVIFFGLWEIHLRILRYSGQGDNFMRDEFKGMLESKPPLNPKPGQLDPHSCPNLVNTWSDCGYAGITEAQCLQKGCCWDPTSSRAWCYHLGEQKKPTMKWWPKMMEVLRATWANNNGGAVMEHPFMSQWWEWPTMNASTVPFAATKEGGQLKALGNPAVWLGVTVVFCLSSFLWVLIGGRVRGWWAGTPSAAALDPLIIPFITLYLGYLLNLVPYQLITRSKFVYHYIPALMVGVLLFATSLEVLLRAATVRGKCSTALARVLTTFLFLIVLWGFWYWGVPYSYGYKISQRGNAARLWNKKW